MIVAGVCTVVGFSNLKNCRSRIRTRIQKFRNRSGVGVWKSGSGHLWSSPCQLFNSIYYGVIKFTDICSWSLLAPFLPWINNWHIRPCYSCVPYFIVKNKILNFVKVSSPFLEKAPIMWVAFDAVNGLQQDIRNCLLWNCTNFYPVFLEVMNS